MNLRKALWLGLLTSLVFAPAASAQPGGIPGAPIGGVGGVGGVAAPQANLWSFFCMTPEQKAACKTHYCNSPLGQLTTGAAGPVSAFSGGLFPNRCLQNSIANGIKKPADDPEGLAARIMADEEEAKKRRAAVRFFGTVDCNYWPEAKELLIKSLRKDRNECVRFEAALALRSGCCCNAEVVEALKLCVTMSDADGNPPERSDRVRAAAADALALCVLPVAPEPIDGPKNEKGIQKAELRPNVDPSDYYKKIAQMPREQVVNSARNVLVSMQKGATVPSTDPRQPIPVVPPVSGAVRPTSVSAIVSNAMSPAGPGPRQPFFSGLTKSLTGRQELSPPMMSPEPLILPPTGTVPGVVVNRPIR